jgi:molybdopterin-binding protein
MQIRNPLFGRAKNGRERRHCLLRDKCARELSEMERANPRLLDAGRVRIDARDVSLALTPPRLTSITNILPAKVLDLSGDRDPAQVLVRLEVGAHPLLARITRRSAAQLGIAPGTMLYAQIKSVALME